MIRKVLPMILLILLLAACTLQIPGRESPAAETTAPEAGMNATPAEEAPEGVVETPRAEAADGEPLAAPEATAPAPQPEADLVIAPTSTLFSPDIGGGDPPVGVDPSVQATQNAPVARQIGRNFRMQQGSPVWMPNIAVPEAACNWMGVAGQVFALNGQPEIGLIVEVGGSLGGQPVLMLALTGAAQQLGPGGFVVTLGNTPVASQGTLYIQLVDLEGTPISARMAFDTFAGCDRNLVLVNLVEGTPNVSNQHLPLISKNRGKWLFLPNIFRQKLPAR